MSPEKLAKVLRTSSVWCEQARRAGLPVARNLSTGEWWLSNEAQLDVWRLYADPPPAPPTICGCGSPFIRGRCLQAGHPQPQPSVPALAGGYASAPRNSP